MSDSVRPHRQQPTRLPCPWDSPGKNTGVGCHFLLQCMKVKSESEVAQSCPTSATPWTAAHQAPLSLGFSRQEHWSGLPFPVKEKKTSQVIPVPMSSGCCAMVTASCQPLLWGLYPGKFICAPVPRLLQLCTTSSNFRDYVFLRE